MSTGAVAVVCTFIVTALTTSGLVTAENMGNEGLSAPVQLDPEGVIHESQPTYRWEHVMAATWYQLSVSDTTGNVINKWFTADELGCGDGTCEATPSSLPLIGECNWWVRGWNADERNGPWTAAMVFTPTCDELWNAAGSGMDNSVRAFTKYNGDLVAGGAFTTADGDPANYIARWDGGEWHAMGDGMNASVWALTEYDGDLIAGGFFTTAGGNPANHIARWDGNQWHAMSSGMNNVVYALTVHDGELIAGGFFTTASGNTVNYIARWDGSQWQPMGDGMNASVRAFAVYNDDLIAGGAFTTADGGTANYIARWDGTHWHALGDGMNDLVLTMTMYKGDLIAGGQFTEAENQVANNIARWNGSQWLALGTGTNNLVLALNAYNGNLMAGGSFTTAGGGNADRIAQWDGSQWFTVDGGMNNSVFALAMFNNDLMAGGSFAEAGGETVNNIARLDGCAAFNRLRVPAQFGPANLVSHRQPTFTWEHDPNATWYQLWINNASNQTVHRKWYTAEQLGCEDGTCQITPDVTLPLGAGRWWVQGWNELELGGPWSPAMHYTVGLETPVLISPTGTINTAQPTYTWQATPHATWYRLSVSDSTGNVINQWYEASALDFDEGAYSVTPNVDIALGNGTWWVRAWSGPLLNSPWSAGMSFERQP